MMLALLAATLLGVDNDDAPSRFRLGVDLDGGASLSGPGNMAMLGAGIEVAALPARWLRLQLDGHAVWNAGRTGGFTALGGLDVVVPTWWGEVFVGANAGLLSSNQLSATNVLAPMFGARAGLDLLLARPLYVGAMVSYGLAIASGLEPLHAIALGLRVGLAF